MLRIGISCYPSVGGSGVIATELGHHLARLGHEIHFISYGKPFRLDDSLENIFFHQVEINDYELFRYPDYTLPLSVKMAEVSQKYHLDILHVHYAVPHATAALLAKQMLGENAPRVITTLHGTDITLMGKDLSYQPIIKHSIEASCGVTAVSQSLRNDTLRLFDIQRPIEVIHNFIDIRSVVRSRHDIRDELGIGDEFLLIHMSNVRPVKRIPDLLKTLSILHNLPDVKLLILSGGDFSPYEKFLSDFNIRDRVIVRSDVSDPNDYVHAADAGIFCSEQESFGLAIIEVMAAAKPVFATSVGGVPEVITDGINGCLVSVGDIDALVQRIQDLYYCPTMRSTIGEAARLTVKNNFSSSQIVNQYVQYYHRILSNCL